MFKGRKALVNKADEVRKLLTERATRPRIVFAIMRRCRKVDPSDHIKWIGASITQVAHVLDIPMVNAHALVTEYYATGLTGDWKKILDKLDI